jgi:hypothetical protein
MAKHSFTSLCLYSSGYVRSCKVEYSLVQRRYCIGFSRTVVSSKAAVLYSMIEHRRGVV